jgi:hypothetical protein
MEHREQSHAVVDMFNEQFLIKGKLFTDRNISLMTYNMSVAENVKQNSDVACNIDGINFAFAGQYFVSSYVCNTTVCLIKMHKFPVILVMS